MQHLYDNAAELILHGLNLHRDHIFATDHVADAVRKSRSAIDVDIDESCLDARELPVGPGESQVLGDAGLVEAGPGSAQFDDRCGQPYGDETTAGRDRARV